MTATVTVPSFTDRVTAVVTLAERAYRDDELAGNALRAVCAAGSGYDDATLSSAIDDLNTTVGEWLRFLDAPDVIAVTGEHGTYDAAERLLSGRVRDAAAHALGGQPGKETSRG